MAEKEFFVVDSSVVAKWYLKEAGSALAIGVRDDFAVGKTELMAPTLMMY